MIKWWDSVQTHYSALFFFGLHQPNGKVYRIRFGQRNSRKMKGNNGVRYEERAVHDNRRFLPSFRSNRRQWRRRCVRCTEESRFSGEIQQNIFLDQRLSHLRLFYNRRPNEINKKKYFLSS